LSTIKRQDRQGRNALHSIFIVMVCFVHDRHFLHKFHAAVNQLRQSNEFSVITLRQLPKRCCSCPEKRNEGSSVAEEPLLKSMDIDALRLVCLQFELKQYVTTHVLSSPSKIVNYTILSSPDLFEAKEQARILNQFLTQQSDQLHNSQQIHHVQLEFVTPTASEELLNEIAQIKYNLVAKCSSYSEAIQAIYGLWVIITAEDQSHVDIVKHVLQKQWMRFITNIDTYYTPTVYKWQQDFPRKVTNNKSLKIQRSMIKRQELLAKKETRRQMMQEKRRRQVMQKETEEEDENTEDDECLIEEMLVLIQPQLTFLCNRFENSSKTRRPRTHRRQHIMALAMVA